MAVGSELRGRAVAKTLFDVARAWAESQGITRIGRDTAAPVEHLVTMYERWGFEHVDTVQFPGKRYSSAVMTQELSSQ